MFCSQCGRAVTAHALFCQWCGAELDLTDLDLLTYRIKQLRRAAEVDVSRYIYKIYQNAIWAEKYSTFEDYGISELGLKRAQLYNYKQIGEKFIDHNGQFTIKQGEEWGVGKLSELLCLSINEINFLIDKRAIRPEMTLKEIRDAINHYKAHSFEYYLQSGG